MSRKYYARTRAAAIRAGRMLRPGTREELRMWVWRYAGLRLPARGVCAGHDTPLDYLEYVFFERGPTPDTVVWACRGGGKTMIGAAATLLDLLFKPGAQIRILGGSREQSQKMYSYLCDLVRGRFLDQLAGGEKGITRQGFALRNGARVEILTQSQRAVRGTRVQKMRCDEVELFDPAVWSAAQLTTRSLLCDGRDAVGAGGPTEEGPGEAETRRPGDKEKGNGRGDPALVVQASACRPARAHPIVARGAVEVFSTMHKPGGLMAQLTARAACPLGALAQPLENPPDAPRPARKVFTWCVWDVVGRCLETQRQCGDCRLLPWCQGRARRAEGFVHVADVLAVQGRSTRQAWDNEMLCHVPYPENQVFVAFRAETHVRALPAGPFAAGQTVDAGGRALRVESLIAGLDYGWQKFACVWVGLLRDDQGRRVAWILDEYVQGQRTLEGHAAAIKARGIGAPPAFPAVFHADVAGRQHDAHSGRTSEALLKAAGLNVKSRAMQIADGIHRINQMLEPPEMWDQPPRPAAPQEPAARPQGAAREGAERESAARRVGVERLPRLLVDPRCRQVIEALTNYALKNGAPLKDGIHDHVVDALRYALVGHDGAGKIEVRGY